MADLPRPLTDLKVLDLSEGIAGPFCTKLMGAMGADVLKVERPGWGDIARSMPPFFHDAPHPEGSGLFLYLNTNKRSITLNLEEPAGRAICRRLAAWADVLIEDFRPGAMDTWGLGYADLEQINPRLVYTSISDFGQTGPYRDYEGSDIVGLALGGLLYITGESDKPPLRMGGQPAQYFTGLSAFTGALIAVHYQEATGQGQQVDAAMMDGIAVAQMYSALTYAYKKENRGRIQDFAPMFRARDGFVGVMYRQQNWEDFCHLIGRPELVEDPRFHDTTARRANMQELNAIVGEWIKDQPKAELYHTAQAMRMPFGYICSAADLLESPQYQARGYFIQVDHPATGPLTYPGMPLRMGEIPWDITRAPLLGEHNEAVYCGQLGYSKEDLGRLRGVGVI